MLRVSTPARALAETESFIYPGHYEVRKVSSNGGVRWNAKWLWVSQILGGLYIGFEEVDHLAWDVYFGPILLEEVS